MEKQLLTDDQMAEVLGQLMGFSKEAVFHFLVKALGCRLGSLWLVEKTSDPDVINLRRRSGRGWLVRKHPTLSRDKGSGQMATVFMPALVGRSGNEKTQANWHPGSNAAGHFLPASHGRAWV